MAKHWCHCGHFSKKSQKFWNDVHTLDAQIAKLIEKRIEMCRKATEEQIGDGCCSEGTGYASLDKYEDLAEEIFHPIMERS